MRALSLYADSCPLAVSSYDGERERRKSLVSLLIRTPILPDQDPTFMMSFNLNYFSKDFISKCNHTGGSGLQHMNGEEGHNSAHSRGIILKIFNYYTGTNLSERMLAKSGPMPAGLVHTSRMSAGRNSSP